MSLSFASAGRSLFSILPIDFFMIALGVTAEAFFSVACFASAFSFGLTIVFFCFAGGSASFLAVGFFFFATVIYFLFTQLVPDNLSFQVQQNLVKLFTALFVFRIKARNCIHNPFLF